MKNTGDYFSDAARWQALVTRDPAAASAFICGVVTTGIYCRPTCPSRRPKRENVRFFDNWQQAEAAGLRACKRCQPREETAPDTAVAAVATACRLIDEAERPPTLAELAAAVGLSPYYFQRLFKRTMGVTPKQYAQERRMNAVRRQLEAKGTVTAAVYEAGFESNGRFYEQAAATLGMKPSQYQQGGKGVAIRYSIVPSYLGWVLIAATSKGICRIDIGDSPEALQSRLREVFPKAELQEHDPAFAALVAQTIAFLDAPQRAVDLPLDIQGTAFQRRVWSALQTIEPGATASYAEIARQIGRPTAARAVAQACAANTIAVAIPCHRVVRGDGKLGGYRWGLDRKQTLLDREAGRATNQRLFDLVDAGGDAKDAPALSGTRASVKGAGSQELEQGKDE